MKGRTLLGNQSGFSLISIIAVLVILCILAALELPKYLTREKEKEKTQNHAKIIGGSAVQKKELLSDDANNIAGRNALEAAASNVRMVYTKLLIGNTSGATVSNEAVVNLLNAGYTSVGDYVLSYSTSGTDRVIATLQSSSRGKFGTPNSKEILLVR